MPSNRLEEFSVSDFFGFLLRGPAQKQPSAINALRFHFFKDKLNIDTPNWRITKPLKSSQIQARECQKARPLMQKSNLATSRESSETPEM